MAKDDFSDDLVLGLKYPWKDASKLWIILWFFLPIIGWLALAGYVKKIVVDLVKGNNKKLPSFGSFGDNFISGFWVIVLMIPTMVVFMVIRLFPIVGSVLATLIGVLFLPWLIINFYVKGTFMSLWDLQRAWDVVLKNAEEYLIAFIKTLIFGVIYLLLTIVLVGIPCLQFGQFYYLTAFYKRHH